MQRSLTGRAVTLALTALVFFLAFLGLYLGFAQIPDSDSYYHLAVARLYAEEGLVGSLDWTRMSVFATTLGDKELLFHVLLVPFASLMPGEVGGRIALALLSAVIATLLARLGLAFAGRGGLLLPLVVFVGSPYFYARAFRLRPELLALILLLVALELLARRRRHALAMVSAAFALSYTALHVLPALVIAACLYWWLRERRLDLATPAWCVAGTLAGVLLHPHFPDNVAIWRLQNVSFFLHKGQLDVGREIFAPSLSGMAALNAGFWLAAVVLLVGARRDEASPRRDDFQRIGESFAIAAALFFVLFTRMERMVTYFVPFASVAVLALLAGSGRHLATLRFRALRVPIAVALAACSLAGVPRFLEFTARVSSNPSVESDWKEIAATIPPGARVAAHWGPTGFLVWFAPQGRYLNVLDPLFMFESSPATWDAQRRMFEGAEPDVPLVAATTLDSEIVFALARDPAAGEGPALRFEGDPRVSVSRVDDLVAATILPFRNHGFVLDWMTDGRRYPRLADHGADFEGFVDASRIGGTARCVELERVVEAAEDGSILDLDFSPYGPGELSLDDDVVLRSSGTGAILANASRITRRLDPGDHVLRVKTCPHPTLQVNGFYLLDRAR
jgi:hypothetical protein